MVAQGHLDLLEPEAHQERWDCLGLKALVEIRGKQDSKVPQESLGNEVLLVKMERKDQLAHQALLAPPEKEESRDLLACMALREILDQ